MKVVIAWVIWTAAFLGWNLFFPDTPASGASFRSWQTPPGTSWHLSPIFYFIGLASVYAFFWVHAVDQWMRRPVLRFGKYIESVGPGFCLVEPLLQTTLEDVPVNDVVEEIEVKHVQTKDNVSIGLTLVLTTRIRENEIRNAVVNVEDIGSAVVERVLTSVTDEAAKAELDHLLSDRDDFSSRVAKAILTRISDWGIEVRAAEIKGLKINDSEIEKAIAMKARAKKEGEAELARADYQLQVAQKLKAAAGTYDENTWRLKGMETMLELCRSAENNTVIIPTELVTGLMNNPAALRGLSAGVRVAS